MTTARKSLPPDLAQTIARAAKLVALEKPFDRIARDARGALWRAAIVVQSVDALTLAWGLRMTGAGRAFVVRFPRREWCRYHAGAWHVAPRVPGWLARDAADWLREQGYTLHAQPTSLPGVA